MIWRSILHLRAHGDTIKVTGSYQNLLIGHTSMPAHVRNWIFFEDSLSLWTWSHITIDDRQTDSLCKFLRREKSSWCQLKHRKVFAQTLRQLPTAAGVHLTIATNGSTREQLFLITLVVNYVLNCSLITSNRCYFRHTAFDTAGATFCSTWARCDVSNQRCAPKIERENSSKDVQMILCGKGFQSWERERERALFVLCVHAFKEGGRGFASDKAGR